MKHKSRKIIEKAVQEERLARDMIANELSQFSYKIISEFENVFPPETQYYPPGTQEGGKYGKYNYYHLNIIPKEGKSYTTNVTLMYQNTFEHFWTRWNRFKKLLAFL